MPGIIQDTGAEGDEVGPDAGRLVEDAPAKPRTPGLPPQIAKGEPPQRWQQDEGGWVLEVTNFRQPLVRQCADQGDEARRSAGASGAPNLRLARAESRGLHPETNSNFNSPSFSTLQATLSPGLSQTCCASGFPRMTPSGVPVEMRSPGKRVKTCEA